MRKIYDCFTFNGEFDLLDTRIIALNPVVDFFVLIEGAQTFNGESKPIYYRREWAQLKPIWHKLRCVVVGDFSETQSYEQKKEHQQDALLRGILDANPDDLITLSSIYEIPYKEALTAALFQDDTSAFAFTQASLTLPSFNASHN